jgi:hypothetical protein
VVGAGYVKKPKNLFLEQFCKHTIKNGAESVCILFMGKRKTFAFAEPRDSSAVTASLHSRSCVVKTSFGHIPSIEHSKRDVFIPVQHQWYIGVNS